MLDMHFLFFHILTKHHNYLQIKNAWNDELHDVVQMSYSDDGPFNTQELNGK